MTNLKWTLIISGLLIFGIAALALWPNQPENHSLPDTVDFNYHIRPILSQNCFVCHGPDSSTREANLRLDLYEAATAKRDEGRAAIVPGKPGKSLLIKRITSHEADFQMPPPESKKSLTAREITLLERWIKQGAEWKPFWAFIPPQLPALQKSSPSEVIDHLLEKALINNNLTASGRADKNSLIRRVSYLLTGLPPSQEAVRHFVEDRSAEAYSTMIDRYLDAPHFGERWARHWMDLVRYAESMGHEGDYDIGHAWEYRDYLIRAFNADVPYDLFVKEHLAGDLLKNPRRHPEEDFNESIMGTGYYYLGEANHGPVNIKLEEATKIDNLIDVTSKAFQSLTVACARCHDHKFDPIPTKDYYAMYGMFESSRFGPLPARRTQRQEAQFVELQNIRKDLRKALAGELAGQVDRIGSQEQVMQQAHFIKNLQNTAPEEPGDYTMLGDFRKNSWGGWYSDGWAFGTSPLAGDPILDRSTLEVTGLRSGYASSRFYATGIQGILRSPNFIVEHDSIALRARGHNSSIRIIVDNYQVVLDPLWSMLEKRVDNSEWTTYVFNTSLVKGHKAYIQCTPGNFQRFKLTYRLEQQDYIEVAYALTFDGQTPDISIHSPPMENLPLASRQKALQDWGYGRASPTQLQYLDGLFRNSQIRADREAVAEMVDRYNTLIPLLYDSTHFVGITEGAAVFSPVFIRGSVNSLSAEKVPRGFLSAIEAGPVTFPQEGSGRLAWAEALVDPRNPLTARVIVNRLWHHLFGRGIVETVDNFGQLGKLPSHPELLDFLAIQMVEENWSIKKMLKHMLLTESFQRATEINEDNLEIDPDNIYLHHFPIRRLEAEAIRDGILAVSGCLDPTMFGKPVPVHLAAHMTGDGRPRKNGPLDGDCRRSIYINLRRNFISPMMTAFDLPTPFSTFGKRNTTNVPAQSLTLMNDPFVKQQAEYWANHILADPDGTIASRITEVYQTAFSREVLPDELEKARAYLETQATAFGSNLEDMKNDLRIWTGYCHAIFNVKEFIHLM